VRRSSWAGCVKRNGRRTAKRVCQTKRDLSRGTNNQRNKRTSKIRFLHLLQLITMPSYAQWCSPSLSHHYRSTLQVQNSCKQISFVPFTAPIWTSSAELRRSLPSTQLATLGIPERSAGRYGGVVSGSLLCGCGALWGYPVAVWRCAGVLVCWCAGGAEARMRMSSFYRIICTGMSRSMPERFGRRGSRKEQIK
jgi:hypothetical protein